MKDIAALVRFMTKPWFLLVYCSIIVISYFYIDKPVAFYFHDLHIRQNWPIVFWITNIGKGQFYVVLFLALAILFRYIPAVFPKYSFKKTSIKLWESRFWLLFFCVFVPCIICLVMKMLIGRARPELLFTQGLYGFYGFNVERFFWSFPSGHVTTITSLILGCMIIWPKFRWLFLIITVLVFISRILLVDHYVSDVLTTALLTLLEVYGLLYLIRSQSIDWGMKRLINE